MKKSKFLVMIIAAIAVIVSACGGASYEAEAVNEDTDTCELCNMMVANGPHATQIILENEKVMKFDDIGCHYEWVKENSDEKIGAEFVRDFNTNEWVEVKDSTFVYDKDFMTPMAYGLHSFKDKAEAEKFIEEEGKGELLTAEDFGNHHWERNMDLMEHHGHGDQDDDADHDMDHDEQQDEHEQED